MSASREWMAAAACLGVDPELFFPVSHDVAAQRAQVAAAKAVCAGCPVRERCLSFALSALAFGVAGGLDEDERRALRRTRAATSPASEQQPTAQPNGQSTVGQPTVEPPVGELGLDRPELARRARERGVPLAVIARAHGVSTRTVERWTRSGAA